MLYEDLWLTLIFILGVVCSVNCRASRQLLGRYSKIFFVTMNDNFREAIVLSEPGTSEIDLEAAGATATPRGSASSGAHMAILDVHQAYVITASRGFATYPYCYLCVRTNRQTYLTVHGAARFAFSVRWFPEIISIFWSC